MGTIEGVGEHWRALESIERIGEDWRPLRRLGAEGMEGIGSLSEAALTSTKKVETERGFPTKQNFQFWNFVQ